MALYEEGMSKAVGGVINQFPYPPPSGADLKIDLGVMGACDADMRDVRERLVPWRFATAFQRATRDAATGNLEIAGGSFLQLFDKGYGETGSACGYSGVLTESDTNAIRNGGVITSEGRWVTLACLFAIGYPFTVAAGDTAWTTKRFDANLRGLDGYGEPLVKAWLDNSSFELTHQGKACKYGLGNVTLWGEVAGTLQSSISARIPGQFWFAASQDVSMGANQDGAVQLRFLTDYNVEVEQSLLNATTAGRDVIIPLHAMLLGVPFCPGQVTGAR